MIATVSRAHPPLAWPRWLPALALGLLAGSAAALWFARGPRPARLAGVPVREISPRGDLEPEERATIERFRIASSSVVYITNVGVRRDMWSLNVSEVPQGTGSGFIWDDQGHIVTNYHVIQGASRAEVTFHDQSKYDAELVGVAEDKDIAVLKVAAPQGVLRPVPLGSSRNLQVGQKVLAIGNPFGLDYTLTTGIISALEREIRSATNRPIQGVIQTDAAINPGNSGGPLLDSAGRLIGMNTAIYSPSGAYAGIGFAVPVDTINRVVSQLIARRKLVRAGLGIGLAPDYIARRLGVEGAVVAAVPPGSAADRAGLQEPQQDRRGRVWLGDVIVGLDDKPVRDSDDLYRLLDERQPGERVVVRVRRGDKTVELPLELQALN